MDLIHPKYPVVMVVWLDANCNNDEADAKEMQPPSVVFTYGELTYKDKYKVNVLPEFFPESDSGRHKTTVLVNNIILLRTVAGEIILDRRSNDEIKHHLETIGGNY